jgi:hypothetical protein
MAVRKKRKPAKRKPHAEAKKPVRRKRVRRKVAAAPKRKAVGKRKTRKRKSVKRGERIKVIHVVAGKKKRRRSRTATSRRRSYRRRPVVMAGHRRTRSVGKKNNNGLLIALGVGALAIYFMTRPKTVTYPNISQLPPLTQTGNYQRNDQTNSILNYALAASLGLDAITKLINSLNSSDDSQIKNIYDHVETTGSLPDTVYV